MTTFKIPKQTDKVGEEVAKDSLVMNRNHQLQEGLDMDQKKNPLYMTYHQIWSSAFIWSCSGSEYKYSLHDI